VHSPEREEEGSRASHPAQKPVLSLAERKKNNYGQSLAVGKEERADPEDRNVKEKAGFTEGRGPTQDGPGGQ